MTPRPNLAAELRALAVDLEAGRVREPELSRLAGAVDSAAACYRRNSALRRLGELRDPGGLMRPWPLAGLILEDLASFEASAAWHAIRTGRREARSTFERLAEVVLTCYGTRDRTRIYRILRGAD